MVIAGVSKTPRAYGSAPQYVGSNPTLPGLAFFDTSTWCETGKAKIKKNNKKGAI